MTAKYFLPAGMAALAIAAGMMSSNARAAQQPPAPPAAARDRGRRRHRRRGRRTERTRSGRLGDRRDDRPSDEVRRRSSSPTIAAAISCPTCRRRATRCGSAGTGWSIRRRSRPRRARRVNLTATVAPDAKAAAQYYPAGYWFSLMRVPDKAEFAATGAARNGINAEHARPGRLDSEREIRRLPRLPPAGQQGDARDPARARRVPDDALPHGNGASSRARPARRWRAR